MSLARLVFCALAIVVLAGCARMDGPRLLGTDTPGTQRSVATAPTISSADVSEFISPEAEARLSAKDRMEAASAQYYALQFGRPGAPRVWQADSGAVGNVLVGPYVRVNDLDCRDFTHEVTLDDQKYARKGTACREQDGSWHVVEG